MAGRIDFKAISQKLKQLKYPALILLLGLVLILWPARQKQPESAQPPAPAPEQSMEAQLEEILSCIDGAGPVRVFLTKQTGNETVYQTDETLNKDADTENRTRTTVLARESGGADVPVERKTVYAQYRGALIVCAGADSPQVRLDLVNAVAGLTGLSTDRITVVKMKQ